MRGRTFVGQATMLLALVLSTGCNETEVGHHVPDLLGQVRRVFLSNPGQSKPDAPPNGEPENTRLYVEVVDADTQQPVKDARVRIVERAGQTDEKGRVLLDNLVPGETLVQVVAPDYARVFMNTRLDVARAAMKVELRKRTWSKSLTQTMLPSEVDGPQGIKIKLPPLVTALGCAYEGDVHLHLTFFDPEKELDRIATPPVLIDELTKVPHPIQMAQFVAIEVEGELDGARVPLSIAPNEKMHVSMPVDEALAKDVWLLGFGQENSSGRWKRSATEKPYKAGAPGKRIWSADVDRLGLLVVGVAVKETKEIEVEVKADDELGLPMDRSVLVRAAMSRSAVTGFTDRNGKAKLVVPNTPLPVVGLQLPTGDMKETSECNGLVCTVDALPDARCFVAGQFESTEPTTVGKYCNGFTWGVAGAYKEPVPDGVGWRCGTGFDGICALGAVSPAGTCDPIFDTKDPASLPKEICNGLDDDCDKTVDEDYPEKDVPCTDGSGASGKFVCNAFGAIVCVPDVKKGPEIPENGIDDDGDGEIDEPCESGQTRECYSGYDTTKDVGSCKHGTQTCSMNGQWASMCVGEVLPGQEVLGNADDDDCDKLVNEECDPDQTRDCYSGASGTENLGVCHGGTQTCDMMGQWGSTCVGELLPGIEIPGNSADEDCNGVAEECVLSETKSCYSGDPLTKDVGECKSGITTCDVNGFWSSTCVDEALPTKEICGNAKDDDCDGVIDDNCNCGVVGSSQACYSGPVGTSGVGICQPGTQLCGMNQQWGLCTGESLPGIETCNGLDDDCDGQTDEDLGSTTCGLGACVVTVQNCVNGQTQTCTPLATKAETCNNIDDDCDGQTDEDSFCADQCRSGCAGTPNGVCDANENSFNCADDCTCGDGTCSGGETPQSCFADCKYSSDTNGMCGNGYCDPWEVDYATSTIHCQQDCWDGVVLAGAVCGNGQCSPQEDAKNCAADCGNLTTLINGDGLCEPNEHWSTSVDCPVTLDAGTFLEAKCDNYALVETYADGMGGTTSHTVSGCTESCGAAPWKLLSWGPSYSTTFDGHTLLRPNCTTCTVAGAPAINVIGDYRFAGWVDMYYQTQYDMAIDPNTCQHGAYVYETGSPWHGYVLPVEWEKVGEKDCSQSPCTVRECDGSENPQTMGIVGTWKPGYAQWSKLAPFCN